MHKIEERSNGVCISVRSKKNRGFDDKNVNNQSYSWPNRPNHGLLAQTTIQKSSIWDFLFGIQKVQIHKDQLSASVDFLISNGCSE